MQSRLPLVWSFRNIGCYCAAGTPGAISRRAIVAPVRAGILSIVFLLRRCQQTSGRQILHRLYGSPTLPSGSLNGPREHGHRRFHIGKVEGATLFAGLLHGRLYSLSCISPDGPREHHRRNVRPSAAADNTGTNYAKHEPTAKLTGTSYPDQLGLWYSLAQRLSSHHPLCRHSLQGQLQVACSCSEGPQ